MFICIWEHSSIKTYYRYFYLIWDVSLSCLNLDFRLKKKKKLIIYMGSYQNSVFFNFLLQSPFIISNFIEPEFSEWDKGVWFIRIWATRISCSFMEAYFSGVILNLFCNKPMPVELYLLVLNQNSSLNLVWLVKHINDINGTHLSLNIING